MSSFRSALRALAALASAAGAGAQSIAITGIGRAATPQEIEAWDIDVRPDFKGLPKGSGTVAQGLDLWEAKCASCHGVFGESNQVFSPLVGGTTKDDVKSGRVARLLDAGYPGRTTLMKVATVSTLWDYIYRAMPWNAPKSLKPDEVYALTAYLLNLADVLPENFTLSRQQHRRGAEADAQPQRHEHRPWQVAGQEHGQRRPARREGDGLHEPLRHRSHGGVLPARPRAQCPRQPGRAEPRGRRATWRRHDSRSGERRWWSRQRRPPRPPPRAMRPCRPWRASSIA